MDVLFFPNKQSWVRWALGLDQEESTDTGNDKSILFKRENRSIFKD